MRLPRLVGSGCLLTAILSNAASAPAQVAKPPTVAGQRASATVTPSLPRGVVAGPSGEGISEYRLANGLTVLLFPDPAGSSMFVNTVYHVGAADENYGETGMAHLLEHLVFKGTPQIANFAAEFNRRGIRFNGTTAQDRTNYYGTFAANDVTLKWLLEAEADRMVHSFIAKRDLDSEMTVVRNEMEMGENRPSQVLGERLRSQAYLWHKYGQDAIGNRADVENVPIERLQAFYRKWYQPDNATVIVAGSFDPAKVLTIIQNSFGRIPRPTRILPPHYTVEPTQDGARQVEVRRTGTQELLAVGYHVPAFTHPDSAALAVLIDALQDENESPLWKALVDSKLAVGVAAMADEGRDPGIAAFETGVTPGVDPAKVQAVLIEQLEMRGGHALTEAAVDSAKLRIANRYRRIADSPVGTAKYLTDYAALGDWRLMFMRRDQIAKVTAADVNRVADTYFKPSNRTLAHFIPTEKPDRAVIAAAPTPAAMLKDYVAQPATASAGERSETDPVKLLAKTQYLTLGTSLKAAFYPRQSRGGLVTLTMMARYGDEASRRSYTGATRYLGELLMSGTASLSREQLAHRLEELGAQVSVGASDTSAIIQITCRRAVFADTLALAVDILRHPALAPEELERLRSQEIAALRSIDRTPGIVADDAMNAYFDPWPKGDPRAFRTADEEIAAAQRVRIEDVRRFHSEFVATSEGAVSVVGDFDPVEVKALLAEKLAGWVSKHPYVRTPEPSLQPPAVRRTFETPDRANAVFVARSNFPMNSDDADYTAIQVAARIFGGGAISSRLGTRIRAKEGLSYLVNGGAIIDTRDRNSKFYMLASTAPENMAKVEAAMREELGRFVRDGISAAELDDARDGLLSERAAGLGSNSGLASALNVGLLNDRTLQWDADVQAALRALTVERVNTAIRRHIKPETVSSFIAGDFKRAANIK